MKISWSKMWGHGISIRRRIYGQLLKLSLAKCGKRFIPAFPLTISGGKNITVGDNFRSTGHAYLYGHDGEISIGNNLSLNSNVLIGSSGGKIVIGDNVLIGPNVVLRAADHGISREALITQQPHVGGVITIEDDVWIGANAVILKDVTLRKGTVVAAGAVVVTDTEPYFVVGGVPARKISERT
jgi:galactoside O-acetyltransferase